MTHRRPFLAPLLAALIAVLSQVAFATLPVMAEQMPMTDMPGHICSVQQEDTHHQRAPEHGSGHACQLCPFCASAIAAVALPASGPAYVFLERVIGPAFRFVVQPRAPPGHSSAANYATGPPSILA